MISPSRITAVRTDIPERRHEAGAARVVRGPAVRALVAAGAGVIVGLDLLGRMVAFAILSFAGPLSAGVDPAIVVFLAASIVATLIALPLVRGATVISGVQSAPLMVLLPGLLAVAQAVEAGLPLATGLATGFAILGGTAIVTGLFTGVLAVLDAGRFVRLMPYPVMAGFLAAAGALMILAAVQMIAPDPAALPVDLATAIRSDLVVNLGLALGFAVLLSLGARMSPDFGAVAAMVAGIAAFFVYLAVSGMGVDGARQVGLLLSVPPAGQEWTLEPQFWLSVEWPLLIDSVPLALAAAFLSALGLMLNISGVEIGLRGELRSRRALYQSAAVNALTGLAGASASFISSTSTLMGQSLGGNSKIIGIAACGVMVVGLVLRHEIIAHAPLFVVTGLLLFVGYGILGHWFLQQRRVQTTEDWLIIGGLVATTLAWGMLPAIALGIVLSCMIFAMTYARLDPIRSEMDLSARRSTVDRGPVETAVLDANAAGVVTLSLQGYLFFGSVDQVVARVRDLMTTGPTDRRIILECSAVSGLDSAAVASMHKLEYLARTHRADVVLAGLRPDLLAILQRQGIALSADGAVRTVASTDSALQEAEAALIGRDGATDATDDARSTLVAASGDSDAIDRLLSRMIREDVPAGHRIIEMGSAAGDIYIIDSGRLGVFGRTADGRPFRMRSFRPGAVVGEIASYLDSPRTADVIAEEPSVLYRLSPETVEDLTRSDTVLAALWHRIAARMLADKLRRTNELIREVG